MAWKNVLAVGACVLTLLFAGRTDAEEAFPLRLRVESGEIVGRSDARVASFRGIPYAAPPVGALRWQPPQRALPWQSPRSAEAPGASCIQKPSLSVDSGGGDPRPIAEDCLFLNIWRPAAATAGKLPVMVWLHGGALVFGSGGVPLYAGAPLAMRGAVVVTVNYRLGALGFFSHPALGAKAGGAMNFGLLDQIAALRWVRDNIAAFGGDAGNVTVFGQSAGAESVLALFASPLARGLFQKGIAQSPYGIPSHDVAQARANGIRIAAALHLDGAAATASALRAVPAEAFAALDGPGESLAPSFIVGDDALPRPILATFRKGAEAPVPLIVGNTSDDGSIAVAFGMDPGAIVKRLGLAKVAVRRLYPRGTEDAQLGRETARDLVFTAFSRRIASLHAQRAPTWRYYFSYVADSERDQLPGVAHGAEIPYTMDTLATCDCLKTPPTPGDLAVAARISQRWFDFARTASPVPDAAGAWPQDARRASRLLEIDSSDSVRIDFMKRRLEAFIGTLNLLGAIPVRRPQ